MLSFLMHSLCRRTVVRGLAFVLLLPLLVSSQAQEFIPKSRKAQEKERTAEIQERKRRASNGIQSIAQTRYQFKYGKVNPVGQQETLTRYDSRGNVARIINFNPSDGKVASSTTYRYDKNGNLIEELFKKEETTLKTVHRYNNADHRIETVSYKADGTVDRKVSYIYDETGLLLETVGRMEDGKIFMRDTYLYDGHGNVVEYRNNLRKFVMAYDRTGNLISVQKLQRYFRSYDSVQYNLHERFQYDYDRNDDLIEIRVFRADSTLKSRTQFVVGNGGRVLSEKEYGPDGRLTYVKNLKYDKAMNVVEESGSDRALKFRNVFKYDSRGNRTEWTAYDQINEPVAMVKYTIGKGGAAAVPSLGQELDPTESEEGLGLNSEELFQILGGRIIAPDGTYLGMVVADTANQQSIINSWGQYGFTQSPTSIFNPTVPYGGETGIFSPFNPQCPSPPSIFKDGKFFTYLTDNDSFRPRTAPRKLLEFLRTLSRQN